jgi:hypothetical protein
MPNVLVWDIETVPDLITRSDDEVRVAMGDKFPKHIYNSIACIGALIAHQEKIVGWSMLWAHLTSARDPNGS